MWEINSMNILLLLSYFNFVVWGSYHLLHISIVSQALNRFTLQIMTDVEKKQSLYVKDSTLFRNSD